MHSRSNRAAWEVFCFFVHNTRHNLTGIGLQLSRDTHLAGLDQVLGTGGGAPLAARLKGEVGAHGVRAVADQHGHVVGAEALGGLNRDGGLRAQAWGSGEGGKGGRGGWRVHG